MSPDRGVILLDFTTGTSRRITRREAAARREAQRARGVRMTCEGLPAWVVRWGEFLRWFTWRGYVG